LAEVWPQSAWMSGTEFRSVPFPYLIDEGCPEDDAADLCPGGSIGFCLLGQPPDHREAVGAAN
jgi:hypothetical protein